MGEADKLYQYKPLNKYTIINLLNREIRLNSPKVFNDPYDCKVLSTYDEFFVDNFIRERIRDKYDLEKFKEENPQIVEQLMDTLKKNNMDSETQKQLNEDREKFFDMITNEVFISCFSEDNLSILMWSHYADYHKGICIEYLKDDMEKQCNKDMDLVKVDYRDECSELIEYTAQGEYSMEKFCSTKSSCWSYEKEWRLIAYADNKSNGVNKKFIKPIGIYLGSKIDESDKRFIRDFCEKNKINLYQMKLKKNSFKIYPEAELEFK